MTNGTPGCGADTAPNESPVLVTGVVMSAGSPLTFTASGTVGYAPGISNGPNGDISFPVSLACGTWNGIADTTVPADALLGVFLNDTLPSLTAAPGSFPYSNDVVKVAPGLKQPFFIGTGLNVSNAVVQFIVPAGATRLFLGTMDGSGWYNNVGSFAVGVFGPPQLTITNKGTGQALIIWPTNATGYSLESASNLISSAWTDVTNVPTVVGGNYVVTVNTTNRQQYFRLMNP